ncbi:hypothetical protein MMC10_006866 [Thelotrema lepadinum]|nr:hypothetical protein [Thelotrema lepadinum]
MISVKSVLLFAVAISARAISQRDTAQILADLQSIDSSTRSFTTTVNNWDGSLLGSLGVNGAATDLGVSKHSSFLNNRKVNEKKNQIDSANTDAQDEPVANSADSKEIITYITGTLEPDIEASLTALGNRKANFQADGETSLVENTLTSLQNKTNSYSATLVGIASADQKANAQAAASKINSDFAAEIKNFSS